MPQGRKPSQIDQIVAGASARLLDEEADRQGVPRDFARKIAGIESAGRADVISGQRRSSAGAVGKMQLMPGTARDLGVDPKHLEQNVQGGVKYLRQQLDTFGGDQRKAAAAYNAGPGAVRKYGGVPPYAETQKYANQFPSGGESDIDRIVRGVSAQTPVSTASESEPSTLRKVSAPGRQKTTVRGPVTPRLPSPFAPTGPTGFEQAGQQVAARTSQISPEVAAEADRRGRELTRFQGRSRLGQLGEVAAGGLMQGVDQMVKAASYVNPSPLAYRGRGLMRPEAQRNLEAQIAAQDVALPNTAPIVRGTVAAASQLPAIALAGPAAPVVAGGLAASNADWRDPKRAALQTGIGLLGGAAGGKLAQMAIRPATMAGRLASGTVGGAAGNVLPTAVEQLAYEGKLNPQQLAQQAVIGGATGAALPPGVSPRPRARRPQSPIDIPVYDDAGEITGYDRINAPLTPDVVGQGVHRAGDLGATVQRAGDIRPRPRGTSPMPIQSRLAELTPPPDAPATTAMPPLDPTQIPAQPASNPLAILNANANEAKINAAQFEAAGDWESARREYDVAHKSLVAAQRQMGRPKTGEEADALTAVQREISAAAGNRDRARRSMMAAGRVAAKQQKAVEDAPTTDLAPETPETSPLLKSVVNPEGGIPDVEESPSGLFGQLGRQQAVEQAKPQRGPKDSGQLSAAEYLKRATEGEGVRVSDRGEARVLGAKEAGIVGLTNRASQFTTSDAQVMLDEGGFSLPDGRKFTDPSVTENDVLAFLAESGREGRLNTRDLDTRIEQEAADYYANQPTGDLPERTAPLTEGVSRGMARAPRIGQMPPSGRFASPETPAQRPQTVAEQARQAGDVTDDLALIDQLNRRLAVEEPRPYGERTRSGEPGTALSYSPYNDLVTNNRGAIKQLRQMNVDSVEAGEIIARIDDFAEKRGIEPRHVENMLNYIRNEQVDAAQRTDEGVGSAPLRQTPSGELRDFFSRPDEAPPRSEPLRPVRPARPAEMAPVSRKESAAVEPEPPVARGNVADDIADDLRRLHAMNPAEVDQALRNAEARRNEDIRNPQMNEVERRNNRDLLKFANERRHEMVRAKQLPAKSPRGPARGERPTAKEAASIKNPLEQDVTILSDEDLAKRIRDAERILNAPELSQDRRRKVDGFLNRAKQEQGKRTPETSPETPRTVSHPDPAIDGQPILAETADGRVIVPNEENQSGVSVVKPDRARNVHEGTPDAKLLIDRLGVVERVLARYDGPKIPGIRRPAKSERAMWAREQQNLLYELDSLDQLPDTYTLEGQTYIKAPVKPPIKYAIPEEAMPELNSNRREQFQTSEDRARQQANQESAPRIKRVGELQPGTNPYETIEEVTNSNRGRVFSSLRNVFESNGMPREKAFHLLEAIVEPWAIDSDSPYKDQSPRELKTRVMERLNPNDQSLLQKLLDYHSHNRPILDLNPPDRWAVSTLSEAENLQAEIGGKINKKRGQYGTYYEVEVENRSLAPATEEKPPIKGSVPEEAMPELRSNRERGAKTRDQSPLIDMVQVRDVKKRLDQLDKQIEKLEEFYDDDDPQLNRGVSQLEHQINQSIAPLLSDLEVQRNTITGKIRQLDDAYDEVVHKIQEIKGRDRGNEREHMRKRADDALAAFSKQLKEIDSRRGQLETSEDKLRDIVDAMEERIVITETPEIERLTKEHDQLWQMWAASKEGTTERKTALSKLDEIGERLSAAIDAKRVLALGNRERGAKTRADVENSPEFKKWFGDSKVVDDQGKPLVVYHGTKANFTEFQTGRNKAEGEDAIFFSPDTAIGSRYTGFDPDGNFHSPEIGSVMPVYLHIKNPKIVDFEGGKYGRKEAIAAAKAEGKDGVIFRNHYDAGGVQDQYAVFSPDQIKSATGNRGTFDPNDANITRQRGNQPPPMPDRVTARDLADNIRAEYRPAANRPGTVYLNDWGLEALNAADYLEFRAVREGAADDRITGGVNYPPEEARQIADHIRERAGRPNFSDEGRKNLETMARQIELAADDGNVSFVPMKGQALGQAKATIRHEAFHSQQSAIHPDVHELTTPRWLRAQRFGAAIGEELSRRGYSERQHPAEAAAFVASGNWDAFGMSRDDARQFLTDYFDNVAYRHGKEAINKFRAIHPALQEVVEARRGTNEPRFGSPGLGRSAESAVNRQRGIEGPSGSVARSRGSVPGGNTGAVRGQSQTSALRAITPESLRAGQPVESAPTQNPRRQGLAGIRAEDLRAESGAGGNGVRPPRAGRRPSEPEEPNAADGPKDTDKPAGFWSKLSDVRKAGLLSGPKTHIVNMLGNTAYQVTEEVSRIPAGIMDMALSAATGRRSVAGANPMAVARASRKAATDGIREAVQIMKTGIPKETAEKLQLKESKFTNPILKGYTQFVFRALGAEDQIFKTYALTRSLESQAKAMALNDRRAGKIGRGDVKARMEAYRDNPTNEMSANAIADAEVATFQNDNKLSSALRAGRGQIGEFGNFAVDLFLPFDRTPTNIIARTLEMTPLGFGKTAKQLAEAIGKKSFDEKQQRAFAQTFGRASTGSALIYLGYALAAQGVMTGLADPDPRKRAKQEAIAPPAAIKINGRWFQVGKFAPAGVLMGLGATIHRDTKAGKGVGDVALSTATGMGRIALEQPMLKAGKEIADLSRAQTIPGKGGRMVGSFIPTIVDNVGTLTDPYQRDTKTFLGGLGSRIPGVRRLLPVRKDARGRPIKTEKTDVIDPFSSRPARP